MTASNELFCLTRGLICTSINLIEFQTTENSKFLLLKSRNYYMLGLLHEKLVKGFFFNVYLLEG